MSTTALRRLCRPLALASACALISASSLGAANGVASGKVGLIDAGTQAFGFSASTNLWTPRNLDSPAAVLLSGEFLGYIRTQAKILLYNSTNDRWVAATYAGTPLGEEVEGATGVFWSTTTLYGSAAHWTVWKTTPVPSGETPIGGGSAGSFGLVWSSQTALAFHAAPGTWISQALDGPCLGGIASDGLGLVWTPTSAYSFDPALGTWTHLDLGATNGVSVAGSGDVALVWGDAEAQAYSGVLGSWFPYTDAGAIEGGAASGEIGLFWSAARAYCFNANLGLWSWIDLPGVSAIAAVDPAESLLRLETHPGRSELHFRVLGQGTARVRLLDPAGREVRAGDVGPGSSELWDRSSSGAPLAAGVYWLEARRAGRIDSRRAVILGS